MVWKLHIKLGAKNNGFKFHCFHCKKVQVMKYIDKKQNDL